MTAHATAVAAPKKYALRNPLLTSIPLLSIPERTRIALKDVPTIAALNPMSANVAPEQRNPPLKETNSDQPIDLAELEEQLSAAIAENQKPGKKRPQILLSKQPPHNQSQPQ